MLSIAQLATAMSLCEWDQDVVELLTASPGQQSDAYTRFEVFETRLEEALDLPGLTTSRRAGGQGEGSQRLISLWGALLEASSAALLRPGRAAPAAFANHVHDRIAELYRKYERRVGPVPSEVRERVSRVFLLASLGNGPVPDSHARLSPRLAGNLQWPLCPVSVTSPYGLRTDPIEPHREGFHVGLDLLGEPNQTVHSAGWGRVLLADTRGQLGRLIQIIHAGGRVTSYAHLASILVEPGDRVRPGTPIGTLGSSGRTTGPHLHFEIHSSDLAQGGAHVAPQLLLPSIGAVLTATKKP